MEIYKIDFVNSDMRITERIRLSKNVLIQSLE